MVGLALFPSGGKRMKKPLTLKKRAMYDALVKQLGVVTAAAEQAGISRETHYEWMKKDPNYKAWIEDLPERTHDFVENALLKEIKKGNHMCIMFYLKTKGKERGYVEEKKLEVSGSITDIANTLHTAYVKSKDSPDDEPADTPIS